jgi:chromosome segregation ATPase
MQVIAARQAGVTVPERIIVGKTGDLEGRLHPPVRPVTPGEGNKQESSSEEPLRTSAWLRDVTSAPQIRRKPLKLDSLKSEIDKTLHELESGQSKHENFTQIEHLSEGIPEAQDPISALESSYEANVHKGEYFVLKRNYDSLISVLKQQEEDRMRQVSHIEDLQHEIEETKAAFEVDLETYKLENIALKQKLRQIQEAKDWTTVCDLYESEIDRLNRQVKEGREEVIALLGQMEKEQRKGNIEGVEEAAVLQKEQKMTILDLRNHLKKTQNQLQLLENEIASLKKQERRWKLNRKGLESISKRTGDLQTHVNKQKSQLEDFQQANEDLEAELLQLRERNGKLETEVEEVVRDNCRLVEDLRTMREVAINSGLSPATLDRLQRGTVPPPPPAAKMALSLIQRLQKTCETLGDRALGQLADNVAEEVKALIEAFEASASREQNLLHVLIDLQEKLGKRDQSSSKEANKALRSSLLASLSS